MRSSRRRLSDDAGVTAAVFALILPAVIAMQAFVVDLAIFLSVARHAQMVADTLVLAAAPYLVADTTAAQQAATSDIRNLAKGYGSDVSVSIVWPTASQLNDRITVTIQETPRFAFASSLGLVRRVVTRSATAQVGQVGALAGVMPFGVEAPSNRTFTFGSRYCLTLSGSPGTCSSGIQGDFNFIDIDDKGNDSANTLRTLVATGSVTKATIGAKHLVVSGAKGNPVSEGLTDRIGSKYKTFSEVFTQLPGGRHLVLDSSCKQIVIVPIVTRVANDSARKQIDGFGLFFISGSRDKNGNVSPTDSNGNVIGQFVDTIVPNAGWAEWTGQYYGARSVRLVTGG